MEFNASKKRVKPMLCLILHCPCCILPLTCSSVLNRHDFWCCQQTLNLSQTLHGLNLIFIFTPQNIVVCVPLHFKNNTNLKQIIGLTLIFPNIHSIWTLNHLLYTCLHLKMHKILCTYTNVQNSTAKPNKVNIQQTAWAHKNILPQL